HRRPDRRPRAHVPRRPESPPRHLRHPSRRRALAGPGVEWATHHGSLQEPFMATIAGAKPHPIFLAGRWVESPDQLVVANPAKPDQPAGATFHATPEQYEEAVEAAVAAFETTRHLPAYERGRILRDISAGIKARREELGRLIALEAGKPIRDALIEVDRAVLTFRLGAA